MKTHYLKLWIFIVGLVIVLNLNAQEEYTYRVPDVQWENSFGNHRAVLRIDQTSPVVSLDFHWRRHDREVEKHAFLIVNAQTGDTVRNVQRLQVDNENCKLLFGPVEQGTYYFYYLSYEPYKGQGGFHGHYYPVEASLAQNWLRELDGIKTEIPAAVVEAVESRTQFDRFYPMEVIATKSEESAYQQTHPALCWIFPEDRSCPVRMFDHIPNKWLKVVPGTTFSGTAQRNEYYAFQLALWNGNQPLPEITYQTDGLNNGDCHIPSQAITCFNTEGTNPYGSPFKINLQISSHAVQPLWFGVDIKEDQPAGIYTGDIKIYSKDKLLFTVPVSIIVDEAVLADRGDSEIWRHSRLRWLNSTRGINHDVVKPYIPVGMKKNALSCLGRNILIGKDTPLPLQVKAWNNEILSSSIKLIVETNEGIKCLKAKPVFDNGTGDAISWQWRASDNDLKIDCKATLEFDGWMNYIYTVTPTQAINVKDIRMEIPMKEKVAKYVVGMGLHGQEIPQSYHGTWDAPIENRLWPFDSFWIGSAHAGLHCELRGSAYTGPLLNLYHPAYPDSWYNEGKGGFTIEKQKHQVVATIYSGERQLKQDEPIIFDFALLVTPVKEIDYKSQFTDRYYHSLGRPEVTDADVEDGVKIINIHHANEYNPFINYPFLSVDKLKDFTRKWHKKGCKVKIYYTIRELTSAATEIWALRSLGNEIFDTGKGGGYPWLREHLVDGYRPQWYHPLDKEVNGIVADAAIQSSPDMNSRWYNYYIEGLAWIIENADIDGLYLDDVAYDRRILKSMRRVMDEVKPGCIIDLHSNTGFSKGPVNQYAEFFPYINKVWFGESFVYNKMKPVNWLVESSGIPFGLMGDMLHAGGNQWLGMQYGMTSRYAWFTEGIKCDPRPVWKVWDDFGIRDAYMVGFWEDNPIVTSTDTEVKVTSYVKDDRVLLSIGNYGNELKEIRLNIDWKRLKISPKNARIKAPYIKGFQDAGEYSLSEILSVPAKKGLILYLE